MRLAYLDEAGISNLAHEPVMTVAGIVVDGDKQWRAVEQWLDSIVKKYVPDAGPNFSFHAYELFGGTKAFDRSRWPLERRLEILDALADIPRRFDLPICHGSVDRKAVADLCASDRAAEIEKTCHGYALFMCLLQIEVLLHATASNEVAMLIAEDRKATRSMLKVSQAMLQGRPETLFREMMKEVGSQLEPWNKLLPLQRVIETVHFAQKSESSLLQLADLCAFSIKRHVLGKPHSERLYDPLKSQFIFGDRAVGFGPLVHPPSKSR